MKIKIPSNLTNVKLTDAEKVIANLILNIAFLDCKDATGKQKYDWMNTEYYFYKKDLGRIMNTEKLCGSTNLKEGFRIGKVNSLTVSIKFIHAECKKYGTPDYIEVDLKEPKAVNLHYYLMGRFSYPDGIIDNENKAYLFTSDPLKLNAYATSNI